MKKITLYIASILLLGSICSCLDDKNDYNYKTINELKGNIGNLNLSYGVSVNEDLTFKPTFQFTIDDTDPDVSYEWRLNGKLLDVKTPEYTFNSSKSGAFELTYSVVDNKTGVKFSQSTTILVRSPYLRGWVILTEKDGKSTISFIKLKTLYGVSEFINESGVKIIRDSIAYHEVEKELLKDVGTNPKGIMEHLGHPSTFGKLDAVYDELVVMQDRWVELNGNTLVREVYTDEEFDGDLPQGGFKPVEAAMSYSAKFVRDENGYIYLNKKALANDFHAGVYLSIPLWNKTEFSALYPVQKFRDRDMDAVLACRKADNTLVIIRNPAIAKSSTDNPLLNEESETGNIAEFVGTNADKFQKMDKDIVALLPAPFNDSGDLRMAYAILMRDKVTSTYQLRFFMMKHKKQELFYYFENDLPALTNKKFTDMVAFGHKQYVVIAMGNELWYCQFGEAGIASTPILLHTFDKKIVSISYNDIELHYKLGPYNGQLGVALEDGSFFIYGVVEKDKQESGLVQKAELNQLYPNEESNKAGDNKFGKIIDVLYKVGNAEQLDQFDF